MELQPLLKLYLLFSVLLPTTASKLHTYNVSCSMCHAQCVMLNVGNKLLVRWYEQPSCRNGKGIPGQLVHIATAGASTFQGAWTRSLATAF